MSFTTEMAARKLEKIEFLKTQQIDFFIFEKCR